MATIVGLTNRTRGTLHLGRFYKIAPHKTLTIAYTEILRDEDVAATIYRFAKEGKLFGSLDGVYVPPEDLILEFMDPMSTSRGIAFPPNAPVGKFFFRTDLGANGEMYLRDNNAWLNLTPTPAAHGSTHLPGSFGGTDPIPGIERLQDMYNCTLGETVLDLVYQSAGDEVQRADASGLATMPAIGFIESKPTGTSCVITTSGILSGFLIKYAGGGGLTPDTTYFADPTNPGLITSVPPSVGGQVSQVVGYAKNNDELLVSMDDHILL